MTKMADNPLVSIITPVLNGIKYLELCIQSVLQQAYPHIEHIFVDGGSTDSTLDVLGRYQAKYPGRIRLISEPDTGPEEAWNKGLAEAKGEIFGWLGADDTYEPDAIKAIVDFFRANPEAYFVFGGGNVMDERGRVTQSNLPRKDFNLKETINDKCEISALTAFYRRQVVEKVGPINTGTRQSELDYWVRVGKVFRIYRIEKRLASLRVHQGSYSGSLKAARESVRDAFIISRQHGGNIFSPRARRYYRFVILDKLGLYPIIYRLYAILKVPGR